MHSPFYSSLRGIGLVHAWHDQEECPIGRSIAQTDRTEGTGDLPRCRYCALLDALPQEMPAFLQALRPQVYNEGSPSRSNNKKPQPKNPYLPHGK